MRKICQNIATNTPLLLFFLRPNDPTSFWNETHVHVKFNQNVSGKSQESISGKSQEHLGASSHPIFFRLLMSGMQSQGLSTFGCTLFVCGRTEGSSCFTSRITTFRPGGRDWQRERFKGARDDISFRSYMRCVLEHQNPQTQGPCLWFWVRASNLFSWIFGLLVPQCPHVVVQAALLRALPGALEKLALGAPPERWDPLELGWSWAG